MPALLERIERDRTQARRDKNPLLSSFLGFLISEARAVGKNRGNRESTDEEVISIIRKQIERNNETLRLTNGEDTTADWQIKIMSAYLPQQIPDSELSNIIREIIEQSGEPKSPRLIGTVMAHLKTNYHGQYDPTTASAVAKNLLQ